MSGDGIANTVGHAARQEQGLELVEMQSGSAFLISLVSGDTLIAFKVSKVSIRGEGA